MLKKSGPSDPDSNETFFGHFQALLKVVCDALTFL